MVLIEQYRKPGRLLDVGCNVGTFLLAARERGWATCGLEANPRACAIGQERGLEIVEGFFEPQAVAKLSASPDAIHMGDVIEHFKNPLTAIMLAGDVLPKSGTLSIVTPDFDSWLVRR